MSHYSNMEEFINDILSQITEYLPNKETMEYSLEVVRVPKNNDVVLTGISITEGDRNISPTIYLDKYYRRWQNGEYMSLRSILKEIADTYQQNRITPEFDISDITDFEKAKNRITRRLVNYEMNQDLLANMPYIEYENLAIIYSIDVWHDASEEEIATVKLDNKMFQHYGVTLEELDRIAKENTERIYEPRIIPMAQAMYEKVKDYIKDTFSVDDESAWDIFCSTYEVTDMQVYYVGNDAECYGAVSILSEDVQDKLAESFGNQFCVIPSSVHEVLALPFNGFYSDFSMYEEVINEVNSNNLTQEQILSNTMYMVDVNNHVLLRMDRAEEYFREQESKLQQEEMEANLEETEKVVSETNVKKHRLP